MKKSLLWIVVLLLSIAMVAVFSLAGCKAKAAAEEEAAPAVEEAAAEEEAAPAVEEEVRPYEGQTITLLFYSWDAYAPEVITRFTDLTGITVEAQSLAFDELDTKINTSSAAGVIPADVFTQWDGNAAALAGTGYLEPLNEYLSDELSEDLIGLETYTHNGVLVGIPVGGTVYIGIVNNAKLSEAGFDTPPETLDELVEMCLEIKEQGIDEYPLSVPFVADSSVSNVWTWFTFALGGELFDENYQPLFVSEAGHKALEILLDNLGVIIDPAMIDTIDIDSRDLFASGRGVFMFGGYASLLWMSNPDNNENSDDFGPMLIPGSEENRSGTVFVADALCMSSLSENKEAAWEFIKYSLSDETLTAQFESLGNPPTRKSILSALEEQGLLKFGDVASEQSEYIKEIFPGGIPLWGAEWQTAAGAIINNAGRGNITIDEALQEMADSALELQEK